MWRVVFWLGAGALAVPALNLTVARAVDSGNGTLIRMEAFTPLALPLYAGLLVLLAFGAARRPGGRKPRVVAALLAATTVPAERWWFSPQNTAGNPAPTQGAERI